jgi:hypothetical protein
MTWEQLMDELDKYDCAGMVEDLLTRALRSILEMHKPRTDQKVCILCSKTGFWIAYPCPTIRAIERELINVRA